MLDEAILSTIKPEPGNVLVVEIPDSYELEQEEMERIAVKVRERFDGAKVVVLPPGATLTKHTPTQEDVFVLHLPENVAPFSQKDLNRIGDELSKELLGAHALILNPGLTLTRQETRQDAPDLVDLLNRVDDHLDKIICTDPRNTVDSLSMETLRLRGEIVQAIETLRAGTPEKAIPPSVCTPSEMALRFGYPWMPLQASADAQEQGGDSDVAALAEAAGDGVVIDPVGFQVGSTINFYFVRMPSVLTETLPPQEAEPQRQETWRDRPPML